MSPRPPTTTSSRRLLTRSSRNPLSTTSSQSSSPTWSTMTSPSARRSLHHCSLRSEKKRAVDKLITLLNKVCRPVSRLLYARMGRLIGQNLLDRVQRFESEIPNVQECPTRVRTVPPVGMRLDPRLDRS